MTEKDLTVRELAYVQGELARIQMDLARLQFLVSTRRVSETTLRNMRGMLRFMSHSDTAEPTHLGSFRSSLDGLLRDAQADDPTEAVFPPPLNP